MESSNDSPRSYSPVTRRVSPSSRRSREGLVPWILNNPKAREAGYTRQSDLEAMSELDLKKLKRTLEKRQAAQKQYQKNKKVRQLCLANRSSLAVC